MVLAVEATGQVQVMSPTVRKRTVRIWDFSRGLLANAHDAR